MIFVGRAARDAHEHHAHDVVQHVEAGLERRAKHRERTGARADDELGHGDDRVERENDEQRAPHRRETIDAGLPAAVGGGLRGGCHACNLRRPGKAGQPLASE